MVTSKQKERKFSDISLVISIISFALGIILYLLFNKSDIIQFIGGTFIQIGISLIIINIIISKIGQEIFRQQIREDLREEMITLVKKYPYKVNETISTKKMIPSLDKTNPYNLDILEETTIDITALEDNTHYRFRRGSANVKEKLNFYVLLDGILLDNKKDIHFCGNDTYQIIEKLKKDKLYKIKIVLKQNNIMSDLKADEINQDYFIQEFIELTDYSKTKLIFPFKLDKYKFFIRRIDSCGRIVLMSPKIKDNIVLIEQENLHDGDKVEIAYSKK
ncbi:MAG: hypothetical protein WCX73_00375 [Candidatus Pacearchaeota archaeon]|jgi:hypothetical protein